MAVYLIPCPIEEGKVSVLPEDTLRVLYSLTHFVVEKAKTARHFIKAAGHPLPIASLHITEINPSDPEWKNTVRQWLNDDISFGIISEAGCPGIADPGSEVVAMAHQAGIKVSPLVGPSSILLALMASGMNGQSFIFHGYLPNKKNELVNVLKKLERDGQHGTTQIFMETPYRNMFLLETMTSCLRDDTMVCLACDINHETEFISTQPIKKWKSVDMSIFHKRLCIFLIGKTS